MYIHTHIHTCIHAYTHTHTHTHTRPRATDLIEVARGGKVLGAVELAGLPLLKLAQQHHNGGFLVVKLLVDHERLLEEPFQTQEAISAYLYNSMRTHTCSSSIKTPSDTQMEAISEPSNLSSLFMYTYASIRQIHTSAYVSIGQHTTRYHSRPTCRACSCTPSLICPTYYYMYPHTAFLTMRHLLIYSSDILLYVSYYYICVFIYYYVCVLLLYMCPHILLCMCPSTMCVLIYYYVCVLLLYMCPHTALL
jgi:hypothetical protein